MTDTIPTDWNFEKVEDVCEILDSLRVPLNSQERLQRIGKYPYYGANGIQDYVDDFIFEGEAILLAEDGGNFNDYASRPIAQWVEGKYWVNNHAHVLKSKGSLSNKWIFYSLVHKNILKFINGGTRSKLNQGDLREILIPVPPLVEQEKIADILTSVDDTIEHTQTQVAKLQDLKTATMNELLTRGIGHTEFKESALGLIPTTWEEGKLSDFVGVITSGGTPKVDNKIFYGGDIPFLKIADLTSTSRYIYDSAETITRLGVEESSAKVFPTGTVLTTMYGTIGISRILKKPMACNQAIAAFLELKNLSSSYLMYKLNSLSEEMSSQSSQTTQANISAGFLKDLQVVLPPLVEQEKIADILTSLDDQIEAVESKLVQLEALKKSLMGDLLTGKVRVSVV